MKKVFKHYQDPSHGWIAVKRELVESLGLASKITMFSYQRGKTVYLEEDVDAPLVLNELSKRGVLWTVVGNSHRGMRSPIRGYDRYRERLPV